MYHYTVPETPYHESSKTQQDFMVNPHLGKTGKVRNKFVSDCEFCKAPKHEAFSQIQWHHPGLATLLRLNKLWGTKTTTSKLLTSLVTLIFQVVFNSASQCFLELWNPHQPSDRAYLHPNYCLTKRPTFYSTILDDSNLLFLM